MNRFGSRGALGLRQSAELDSARPVRGAKVYSKGNVLMRSVCLTIARVCSAAWIGAAVLFVVTSIREQTSPEFDLITRDQLALVRFPAYYACGFGLVLATGFFGWLGLIGETSFRRRTFLGLMLVATLMMAGDYFMVYQPLVEVITPPGQARTEAFETLHSRSKWVNQADVTLCLIAAFLLAWPRRGRQFEATTPAD